MSETYLSQLNQQQRDAVTCLDAPHLVIAGAGSGKTRVLTYKIVHLLSQGYEAWRILALTFTNKAAREMRERIEQLTGSNTAGRLWMGTFHSIFARILRTHADRLGFKPGFTIYDASDSKSLVKTIIRDLQLDEKVYKPATVAAVISKAKNDLVSPQDYARNRSMRAADEKVGRGAIATIYSLYAERCRVAGAMDFDDLLYFMNILLLDNPDILNHYREFFRYVLVDEYQDTNVAQHRIIRLLTEGQTNLCVVGDDAQSIYSFRGANISNILTLENDYPDLKVFKLERNYRSTQTIVNAASSLIKKNRSQRPKNVFSEEAVGAPIEVVSSFSDFEESYLVANRISSLQMRTKDPYSEFAVLYRTNAQSRILEESLRKRNIPYRIYGGLSFYQRKEVKDAIAYFRLALNPFDEEALRRVINYPARGIGETTVGKLLHAAMEAGVAMWDVLCHPEAYPIKLNSAALKRLADFRQLIESFFALASGDTDAFTVAKAIILRTQLLSSLYSDRTPESISKQENIQELLNSVREFIDLRTQSVTDGDTPDLSLNAYMAEVALATDMDEKKDGNDTAMVTLMTAHAAKGLEFANVFIVGVEEDLFPSAMSVNSPAEIEEERRLLYVAITRAKRFCMLSYASSRYRNGQTTLTRPSRFISDIDSTFLSIAGKQRSASPQPSFSRPSMSLNELLSYKTGPTVEPTKDDQLHEAEELSTGMRIRHFKFGVGTIKEIDANRADKRITVDFDNTGTRVLLLKFARFNILSNE
ncbi:MAG: UvrD-helicase domain-containing protein [Muribaculaceae bacterium]|nr:UvrD-helicase domain-containing protein [Muribaculaceae bacterium]